MTVKPFYIRKTADITSAMVAEVFDKAVSVGAKLFEGVQGFHDIESSYPPSAFPCFGVTHTGITLFSEPKRYGKRAQEITLPQVDEWLGIEAKPQTYCESVGLRVGDRIRLTRAGGYKVGPVFMLAKDDGSECPVFINPAGALVYLGLIDGQWERVTDEPEPAKDPGKALKGVAELIGKEGVDRLPQPDNMPEIAPILKPFKVPAEPKRTRVVVDYAALPSPIIEFGGDSARVFPIAAFNVGK